MVRTCGESHRGRCSDENMEVSGHRKSNTEVDPWYTNIHEGDGNTERRISASPNNLGNENSNREENIRRNILCIAFICVLR